MHSDDKLRLIFALIETMGGEVTIDPGTIEDVYLNTTAEYNWRLVSEKLPNGGVTFTINKTVVHPDQMPLNLPATNTGD